MPENQIRWDVFTIEEREIIEYLMSLGQPERISSAITILDHEQEFEVQKIIASTRKPVIEYESKVHQEMAEMRAQGVEPIQTPEDEALWEEKLKAERAAKEAEVAKNDETVLKNLESTMSKESEVTASAPESIPVLPEAPVSEQPVESQVEEVVAPPVEQTAEVTEAPIAPEEAKTEEQVSTPEASENAPIEAQEADTTIPEAVETVKYTLTDADIAENPELAEKGLKSGDEVELPKDEGVESETNE